MCFISRVRVGMPCRENHHRRQGVFVPVIEPWTNKAVTMHKR